MKVKCDNKQPCPSPTFTSQTRGADRHCIGENCVKRDHANLCSYNPKQNGAKLSGGSIGATKRARSPESENFLRKEEDRWPRTTGKHPVLLSFDFETPFRRSLGLGIIKNMLARAWDGLISSLRCGLAFNSRSTGLRVACPNRSEISS